MTAFTAAQLIRKTIELRADTNAPRWKKSFLCIATGHAAGALMHGEYSDGVRTEVYKTVRQRILDAIDNHGTVERYLKVKQQLAEDVELKDGEADLFRDELLVKLLAEYEAKELLEEQVRILKEVKELRANGTASHYFTCWNIDQVLGNRETAAGKALKDDIDQYIGGHETVREWLSYRDFGHGRHGYNGDDVVQQARSEMIDTLIARYTAQSEAA